MSRQHIDGCYDSLVGTPCVNDCSCWCHADDVTMRELVEADKVLQMQGMVYDYALPHLWCEDFKAKMGHWPRFYVWVYGPQSIWGDPHALTYDAAVALTLYRSKV